MKSNILFLNYIANVTQKTRIVWYQRVILAKTVTLAII